MKSRGLYRSRRDSVLAGVCGGIAEYLDLNPMGVRLAYIVITFFTGALPGILVYCVLAMMLKEAPTDSDF